MNTYDFFGEVKNKVKELSIYTVLSAYGREIVQRGSSIQVRCTMHSGAKLSHASISEKLNCFRCHVCGGKGQGPINYIMETEALSYKDAIMDIAVKANIISSVDYDAYYSAIKQNKPLQIRQKPRDVLETERRPESIENIIAEPSILNIVFSIFSKGFSMKNGPKLIASDRKYLLDRNLTEEDIKNGGYFSIPSTSVMPAILKELKEQHGLSEDTLKDIPGFFKDANGYYTFKQIQGIGIPIRNALHQVVGIQIRLSKEFRFQDENGKVKTLRYIWFSSNNIKDDCSEGTCSGTPVDIFYPSVERSCWEEDLFISEGRFKTQLISKHTNSISASIQGVANWSSIIESIEQIQEKNDMTLKRVFVCYDADMAHNIQVNNHAQKMSTAISEKFADIELFYCIWDYKYGKGIDDAIQNNHIDKVKIVFKEDYDSRHAEMITSLIEKKIDINDLSEEDRHSLFLEKIFNNL